MGADGHINIVRRSDWDAANPDVTPADIGLYTGEMLGVEAAWGYMGDNLYGCGHLEWNNYGDEFALTYSEGLEAGQTPPAVVAKRRAALAWFDANHETHEVWT